jgi:hypothetical protein
MINHLHNCWHPYTDGRDTLMFRRLLANPAFRTQFVSRTADLLNTTLAPDAVQAHVDALAEELAPDITYEAARWPSPSDWEEHVQELRDFASQRPGFIRQHFVQHFELAGTAEINITAPANHGGTLAINDHIIATLPWQGIYFQGIPVEVTAVPAPGYRFAGWEQDDMEQAPTAQTPAAQTPTLTLMPQAIQTLSPKFVRVDKDAPQAGDVVFTACHIDDSGDIAGDWFEIQVKRRGGIDLRGWRITDNDTKTSTDEGSLIFNHNSAFAHIPYGTTIRIIATHNAINDAHFPQDDLSAWDRTLTLYVGNGNLDINTDPWFNLGLSDNLAILAPGPTATFDDDQGIAFWHNHTAITPASFGILADGVTGD